MKKLTYVTGNPGKYHSVKDKANQLGIEVYFYEYDCDELDINDIKIISKDKAYQAYEKLKSPCFVIDSGFYIEDYPNNPGYPGAFVKRSGVATDIEKLLETMKNTTNRNASFIDCLTYYDGEDFYYFYKQHKGIISLTIKGATNKKAKSELWKVFIPKNFNKTIAEMSEEELKLNSELNGSVTLDFLEWYRLKIEKYSKKLKNSIEIFK